MTQTLSRVAPLLTDKTLACCDVTLSLGVLTFLLCLLAFALYRFPPVFGLLALPWRVRA